MFILLAGENYYPCGVDDIVEASSDLEALKCKGTQLLMGTYPFKPDWVEIMNLSTRQKICSLKGYSGPSDWGTWETVEPTEQRKTYLPEDYIEY